MRDLPTFLTSRPPYFPPAGPPINDNAPPRAGAVMWVQGLMERAQVGRPHLDNCNRLITVNREELQDEGRGRL